jgi:hypothetical protein
MNWTGTWQNQYGSVLKISDDGRNQISGTFRTALKDSGFYGQEIAIFGVHQGDCISVAGGGKTAAGDAIVSYTGLWREGKLETLWYVVADSVIVAEAVGSPGAIEKSKWWRAVTTSADTFERMK